MVAATDLFGEVSLFCGPRESLRLRPAPQKGELALRAEIGRVRVRSALAFQCPESPSTGSRSGDDYVAVGGRDLCLADSLLPRDESERQVVLA
jgi:hypothetical protein